MTRAHTTSTALRPWCGALLVCSALSRVVSAPVSAQSHSPSAESVQPSRFVPRHSGNAARVYTDDADAAPQFNDVRLSPNVLISPALQPAVAAMLRDSVTFRRQCARLAGSHSIVITVDDAVIPDRAPFRAATEFTVDPQGRMLARVRIGSRVDLEEMIAHEFEHIIEQLDGVDLPSLARRATAGVHTVHDEGHFETERAIAVGRQVVREIRSAGGHGR